MRLLVVEDDALLGDGIKAGLALAAYAVDWVRDGDAARRALIDHDYDACILDLGLPRRDGLAVLRELRQRGNRLPVIILTARDTSEDKIAGLDSGADDYLTKPFDLPELLARLRALLRVGTRATGVELTAGDLRLDAKGHRVWRGATEIAVTTKELQLLEYLLRHKGQVVARQKLIDALWEHDDDPESNALEVHVASLRRKVDRGAEVALLHTVRGAGYVLREPGR